ARLLVRLQLRVRGRSRRRAYLLVREGLVVPLDRRGLRGQDLLPGPEVRGGEGHLLHTVAVDRHRTDDHVDPAAHDRFRALVGRDRLELHRVRVAEDVLGYAVHQVDVEALEFAGHATVGVAVAPAVAVLVHPDAQLALLAL